MFFRIFQICFLILFVVSCNDNGSKSFVDSGNVNSNNNQSDEHKVNPSNAFLRLNALKYDTVIRQNYIDLALKYYSKREMKSYLEVSKMIEQRAIEAKDTVGEVQAKCFLAYYYSFNFQNDSTYYYYSKAEKLSQEHIEKPFLGSILMNKAELLTYSKDFSGAETLVTEALKIGKERKDTLLIYTCYLILGKSLKGMDNNHHAMKYYMKALKETDNFEKLAVHKLYKAQTYNYISLLYQKQKEYTKAIDYAQKGLALDNFKESEPSTYCYLKNSIAYSEFKNGNEYVRDIFEETLNIGEQLKNLQVRLSSRLNLSEYYIYKKNKFKAEKLLFEVLEISRENKIHEDELKALDLLAKIDTSKSNYYRERYITLSDSLQNVERATRNKFARIEFETDEITAEKKLVEAEKERISAQRWLILGSGLFSIIALTLLYIVKTQRAKNKELRYLQEQQQANEEIYKLMLGQQQKLEEGKSLEKKRISRELHDGIMGKLTAIRLNLFVLQKRNDPETIAKCVIHVNEIQEIEKEIRKIAHDLNNNMFSKQSDFTAIVGNLVENIKEHSSIDFKIFTDESIDWLSVNNNIKMQVYRILQESLQNIEKYAQADEVAISMLKENRHLIIKVADNGIGFDTKIKGGIGLKNMKERALEINGTLNVQSEKTKGTQIILTIPY